MKIFGVTAQPKSALNIAESIGAEAGVFSTYPAELPGHWLLAEDWLVHLLW